MIKRHILLAASCLLIHASVAPAKEPLLSFTDATQGSGIDFQHVDGSSGQHFLMEAVASGLASFDYDLDGSIDLYFINGAELRGSQYARPPTNGLLRNSGNAQFTDCSLASGLADDGFGLGVTVGDINNDGFPDVYINNFGTNSLYLNAGDGTFVQNSDSIIQCGNKVGAGTCMLDIENDGDLDIYVANYIGFEYDLRAPSVFHGRVVYGGPVLYPTQADDLLRNNGDGTFSNIGLQSGIAELAEWGMGVVAFDVEPDGDVDIFVANDSTVNFLWENDGTGVFTEIGLIAGVATDHTGDTQGSMGVDIADIDGDGLIDVVQTAYEKQMVTMYGNLGSGLFEDRTLSSGALTSTAHLVNWGASFGDFDNDCDPDLFIANGHIHDNQDEFNELSKYRMENLLYRNDGKGRFADVSTGSGINASVHSSRGTVADDYNSDGLLDVVVVNSRERPTLLLNSSPDTGNWLQVNLAGLKSNRDAFGAKVVVRIPGRELVSHKCSGRGYQSYFGSTLHFGLGDLDRVTEVEIQWPNGTSETINDLKANQRVSVRQGAGVVSTKSMKKSE